MANEVTTLPGALTDQPWLDYSLGQGVDALSGQIQDTGVQPFAVKPSDANNAVTRMQCIETQDDFQQLFSAELSGSYNMQGVKVSGSASYMQSVSYSSTSMTVIVYYDVETAGAGTIVSPTDQNTPVDYSLTEDAASAAKSDATSFAEKYGNYFVGNYTAGSRFVATYTCSACTSESLRAFKATLSANTDTFSTAGATAFSQTASSSSVSIECATYYFGIKGNPPAASTDVASVPQSQQWFLANMQMEPRRASLINYSQLLADIPNQIDIDPSVFADIQQINALISELQANLVYLPDFYGNQIVTGATVQSQANDLQNTFIDSRGKLINDPGSVSELSKAASGLIAVLSPAMDLYGFYQGIAALPAGSGEKVGTSGADSQSFGITGTSGLVVAVSSQSTSAKIDHGDPTDHKSIKFNWPFNGVGSDQVVVGWHINNNWENGGGTGSNGHWKVTSPMIGKSVGEIDVRGDAGHGVDWTLTVYYVPNSEFPWLNA